jgi:ATP-dependent DNA helicase RecG
LLDFPSGLDEAAIKRYTGLSRISEVIGLDGMLMNMGVLCPGVSPPMLNNAGVLFFAKNITRYIPQAVITCILFKGNDKVHIIDKKTFGFDLLSNIDQALAFLVRHLNLAYEIRSIRRTEILEIPEVVLREAVVNAVAHRDYFEKGAEVMVEIFDNRVEISNPGGLPRGLQREDFGKLSLARNPVIAHLLHRCGYIEKAGTGIQRMRDEMRSVGLPPPWFTFYGFFSVTLERITEPVQRITPSILEDPEPIYISKPRMERVLALVRQLYQNRDFDIETFARQYNTTGRNIRKDMEVLEERGWLSSSGTTRNRQYRLTRAGRLKALETGGA